MLLKFWIFHPINTPEDIADLPLKIYKPILLRDRLIFVALIEDFLLRILLLYLNLGLDSFLTFSSVSQIGGFDIFLCHSNYFPSPKI